MSFLNNPTMTVTTVIVSPENWIFSKCNHLLHQSVNSLSNNWKNHKRMRRKTKQMAVDCHVTTRGRQFICCSVQRSTIPKLLLIKKHCLRDLMNLVPINFPCGKGLLKVPKAFRNDLHPSLRVQSGFGILSTKTDVPHCNYHRKFISFVKRHFNKKTRYCTVCDWVQNSYHLQK